MSQSSKRAVRIRRALAADAAAMARAHARSWRATYTGLLPDEVIDAVVASRPARVERWQARLAEPAERRGSFVAELDGHVAGFVFWGPVAEPHSMPETAEVYAIYLDPNAIGLGIGRALLDAAVNDIVVHWYTTAVLWVLETNDRARRFYEAAGWRPDGAIRTEERPGGELHEVRYARKFAFGQPRVGSPVLDSQRPRTGSRAEKRIC